MDRKLMDGKLRLRQAGRKDIPILAGFLGELFSLERDFTPDARKQFDALGLILDNPDHARIYVVEFCGNITPAGVFEYEIIGVIALHKAISTASGGWCGRIEDFYLLPEFRRRGIGIRVIEEILAIAERDGWSRVTLVADADNTPALNFYERCGFAQMNLISLIKKTPFDCR